MTEADANTSFINPLEYDARISHNKKIFLLNFGAEYKFFDLALRTLQKIWLRVVRERDPQGKFSQGGLMLPAMILENHLLFGFERMASYQSLLAWPAFRPGLEALLIAGKWIDDPAAAEVWRNRRDRFNEYRQLFSGKGLVSRSLPRSSEFRAVLSHLNDEYLHANADFCYGRTDLRQVSPKDLVLSYPIFEKEPLIHEAHLRAYLSLTKVICESSEELLSQIFRRSIALPELILPSIERYNVLARNNPEEKRILEQLGLWRISE
jgi:hypothetical protein